MILEEEANPVSKSLEGTGSSMVKGDLLLGDSAGRMLVLRGRVAELKRRRKEYLLERIFPGKGT